ncbi:MAG: ATP-binding cassette domain-containing protein [Gemmatimonadales bacterium]|nr:ATP-binding cassette domain-containing protein [Gemmatimonadales bacterium]
MHSYKRMISMIRPYMTQLILSIFFMVLFSITSIFSITMISPFLRAVFDTESSNLIAESPLGIAQTGLSVGTPDEDPTSRNPFTKIERFIKEQVLEGANTFLLRGTNKERLIRICIVIFVLVLAKNITGYLQAILMAYVGLSIIRDLREMIFLKFTSLPLSFFHQHKAGELISRASNDVQIAHNCVNISFTNLVRDPIFIIMYLGMAFILSWKLTLMAVILMPISLIGIVKIGHKMRKYSHRQQEKLANLTSVLHETIYGIRVIKAFAMEQFENRKFLDHSKVLFSEIFRMHRVGRATSPLTEQLSVAVGLLLLWYGGLQVLEGDSLSPDHFLLFLFLIFSLVHPVKELGTVNAKIQEGMAAADRIFDILDTEPEVKDTTAGELLINPHGHVEFRNVDFSYLPGEPVLSDINLEVKPGEMVALVGSSGGGKSTLIDLIPRFYDPDAGQVMIDGNDLTDLNLGSLRSTMGIVTQEVILFNDTVANNIAYGDLGVPSEKIIAAAKTANAHDFISRMPLGYDTIIGDRGTKLSGGQRQRLSIARAILKDPTILLLDEATSALDTESELLVQEAIDRLVQSRTTIVIAHRLSTIKNVDRIYVLDSGRFVQQGTHKELIEQKGLYKDLYDLQFRN